MLLDDEELELQELEAGPNPLRCSDHFAANGVRSEERRVGKECW